MMADVETKKIVNDVLTEAAKNFAVDSIDLVAKDLLLFKNQVTDLKTKLELARDRKDRSNLTKSMKSAY